MADQDELLRKLRAHIEALEEEIGRLTTPPFGTTTVLKDVGSGRVMIAGNGGTMIVDLPHKRDKDGKPLKSAIPAPPVGSMLLTNGVGAIVEPMDLPTSGMEATVKRVFDGDQMEIGGGMDGAILVFKGSVAGVVKAGDTVLLDRTGSVALRIIPKDRTAYSVETSTGVEWSDIGGQDLAKAALQEAIEGPIRHTKLFKAYGKRPMKGVLLSGPPGCGKTLLAKAAANTIRTLHGTSEAETAFIYVKGPEVLNMWVGNTEAQIRGLFTRAREHKAEHGYPAVIFIDEADAILGRRDSRHGSVLSSTVVPTFLAEMDGLTDSAAFILLATNRQDILDPAIVREGRIDRKIRVDRPQLRDTAQILSIHLGKTKVAEDPNELAGVAAAELFSDTHVLYRVGLKTKGVQQFCIRHLVSGAMLAGVVDMATSIAIRRDTVTGKASGLTACDMLEATCKVIASNHGLNHEEALMMFAESHGDEIEGVQPMAAVA